MRRLLWTVPLLLFLAAAARGAGVTVNAFNPSGPEGNSGVFLIQVVFSQAVPGNFAVTGNYQTVDGTATVADSDYLPASGVFVIPPGETSSTPITIGIVGDTRFEADETFRLVISNVTGGNLTEPGPYTFTILNDDAAPSVTVTSPSVTEGNSGTTAMAFEITLNAPAGAPVQAAYSTSGGTATSGVDYEAAQGTLTFAPGEVRRTVNVNVIGDTAFEENETVILTVTPSGAAASSGTGTIVNDDDRPASAVTIVSGNNQQGRLGQQLAQPLVVRVVNSLGQPVRGVTVQWTVTTGSAQLQPATSVTDAEGRASTNVTLNSVGAIEVRATAANLPPVTFTVNTQTSFESRAQGPVAIPIARALDRICARNEGEFGPVCRALSLLPDRDFSPALERIAPQQSGAQARVATEVVSAVAGGISSRLSAVRSGVDRFSMQQLTLAVNGRPVPLAALANAFLPQEATDAGGSAEEQESDYNGWSAFVSGNLGNGEREQRDGALGFDLKSRGLMFGVDRLLGQNIVGASLNLMQFDADLDSDTGSVDTTGYALSIYGSRGGLFAGGSPNAKFDGVHFDGSLSYGRNTYEAEHNVSIAGLPLGRATSENDANVLAVAAGTGFEAHTGRTDFDFSLSGTWSRASIDDLTEEGSGPLILFVRGQDVESVTATLGLNVRSAFAMPFGTLLPSVRAELIHEFEDGARFVTARFLRDRLGTEFTIPLDRADASYGRVGVGLQGAFPFGWSASLEATKDVLRSDLKFGTVQFNVLKSF